MTASKATEKSSQDKSRHVRCGGCGRRIVCKPSTGSFNRWYGVGKCGCEILIDSRGEHLMRLCREAK